MCWHSKRRHDSATSASEFLAPVALVQVSPLGFATVVMFPGGREREGVQAFPLLHHNLPFDSQRDTFLPHSLPFLICGTAIFRDIFELHLGWFKPTKSPILVTMH